MARANGSPVFLLKGKGGSGRWKNFPLLAIEIEKVNRDNGSDEGGYGLPPDSPDEQFNVLFLESEEE